MNKKPLISTRLQPGVREGNEQQTVSTVCPGERGVSTAKPLKRLGLGADNFTRLKPGANENGGVP